MAGRVSASLGTLVTVTLQTVPDLHTVTATPVLPDLGGLSGPVTHFDTFLVLTRLAARLAGGTVIRILDHRARLIVFG
jgi:hypothetical protein